MTDASRSSISEAGLKCVQGKCIVNAIRPRQGERPLHEQARKSNREEVANYARRKGLSVREMEL